MSTSSGDSRDFRITWYHVYLYNTIIHILDIPSEKPASKNQNFSASSE